MARKYKYWTVWYVDPSSPDDETGICEGCVFQTKKAAEESKVDWEMASENTPGSSYQVVPAMLTRQEADELLNSSYEYELADFFDLDDDDDDEW